MNGIPESQKLEFARNVNLPIGTERRSKNMIGKRFGRWTIILQAETIKSRDRWLCSCDCGIVRVVDGPRLRAGGSKSCGCLKKDRCGENFSTHNLTEHILYKKWCGIKSRCLNKKSSGYKKYGSKGISICNEWKNSFLSFYNWAIKNGWKPELQIDRINNPEGYSPENCRFTTNTKNCQNRPQSYFWVVNGKVFESRTQAAKFFCVCGQTISNWCLGKKEKRGYYYPSKPFCYTVKKYADL